VTEKAQLTIFVFAVNNEYYLMKHGITLLIISIAFVNYLTAQNSLNYSQGNTLNTAQESIICIPQQEKEKMWKEIQHNRQLLNSQGKLKINNSAQTLLAWPLKPANDFSDYGYYTIGSYVDHDSTYPNNLLDYNCGEITYDWSSGYNHEGIDIALTPFKWRKMDNNEVEVIAAADGTIIYKNDGEYDRNCNSPSDSTANFITLQHADGSTTLYTHLKKNSLTTKNVGDNVIAGELLGIVGSSGTSGGAHLHFEVRDASNNVIDPFGGPCNSMNTSSWWIDQRPYIMDDFALLSISTHYTKVNDASTCDSSDVLNLSNQFSPGDTVFMYVFGRALDSGQTVTYNLYRPDNSLYFTSTQVTQFSSFYRSFRLYNYKVLDVGVQTGTWKYEAVADGNNYEHYFCVGTVALPTSQFSSSSSGLQVAFTNNSSDASVYWWDFGDGFYSTEQNPVHAFANGGNYNVCLYSSNGCDTVSSCNNVSISVGQEEIGRSSKIISIYPNPSSGKFTLEIMTAGTNDIAFKIVNMLGQEVFSEKLKQVTETYRKEIDIAGHLPGIYFLKIKTYNLFTVRKIILTD